MNNKRLLQQTFGLTLVLLSLVGCGGASAEITTTPTLAAIDASESQTPTSTSSPPTSTPTSSTDTTQVLLVPGIDEPLSVEDVEVQLSSATRHNSYEVGTQQFSPSSPADTVLVIEATVRADKPEVINEWKVTVVDTNSRESPSQITTLRTYGDGRTEVIWIFVVKQAENSLTLHLPEEQAIPIDTLLDSSASAMPPSGSTSTVTWKELPIMPSATKVEESEETYVFTVNATVTAVQNYYRDELPKLSWQLLRTDKDASNNTILVVQKDSTNIVIIIMEYGNNVTLVQLIKEN